GAYLGGMPRRDALAVSFGMNARGAMEIILGLLALQYGLIQDEMFVALVVLALLSSIISAPFMAYFVERKKKWKLDELLTAGLFLPSLNARTAEEAIEELSRPAAEAARLPAELVAREVTARERALSTSPGSGLAVPPARIDGRDTPGLAMGKSRTAIDSASRDGKPTRLSLLLSSPPDNMCARFQTMRRIARLFKEPEMRRAAIASDSLE